MKRISIISVILVLATLGLGSAAFGQGKKNGKELRTAVERVDNASTVMNEIMSISDKSIPSDLLAKAKAIVIFPGALKAAFIFGGQGGVGVVIRRTADGWSAPAFLNMGGGSFGAQIGGQKTDYVLLIMNDKGLKNLMQDKFEIGGEGSVAAGPVGRTAAASTNVTLDAEILSYSRTKGLFAGLALKGVYIAPDSDLNTAVYGRSAKEILGDPPMESTSAPGALQRLAQTVGKYTK
ncbi:MAG: lipid-binding SYLF domain-containing protein [Acidobacteriota bacterium]